MRTKAVVLGCGLVGATIARDMAEDDRFEVRVVDANAESLARLKQRIKIETLTTDLSDPAKLREAIMDAGIVLGALPSRFGFQSLRTVIESGKPYSDISFMPEDALQLDGLARERGVTAVVDCGVSPGLSNLMIGYARSVMDRADRAEIYVGGLPKARHWPFQYKAPFAPSDVIEEYTRPARLREHGEVVVRPALSEPELMDFPQVGTLEAFNTDGLRSLLDTVDIPTMKEKTLRYPGHIELMRAMRETGLFDTQEIEVRGVRVRPLDVTSKLMFPKWTYQSGEEEFTVLRVIVEGVKSGAPVRRVFDLYDETDRATGTSSMARTTAFPCTIAARMIVDGTIREGGVFPPERFAAKPGLFDRMETELRRRGVEIRQSGEPR